MAQIFSKNEQRKRGSDDPNKYGMVQNSSYMCDGKKFHSKALMCNHYHISVADFVKDVEAGKDYVEVLHDALAAYNSSNDLNNELAYHVNPNGYCPELNCWTDGTSWFQTDTEMCNRHNINPITYHRVYNAIGSEEEDFYINFFKNQTDYFLRYSEWQSDEAKAVERAEKERQREAAQSHTSDDKPSKYIASRRMKSGNWTEEDAIEVPIREYNKRVPSEWEQKTFSDPYCPDKKYHYRTLCARYQQDADLFRKRIENDWHPVAALFAPKHCRRDRYHLYEDFDIDGKYFRTKEEWCEHYNVPLSEYEKKKASGMTDEDIAIEATCEKDKTLIAPAENIDKQQVVIAAYREINQIDETSKEALIHTIASTENADLLPYLAVGKTKEEEIFNLFEIAMLINQNSKIKDNLKSRLRELLR